MLAGCALVASDTEADGHIPPDFQGNRSPRANSNLRGAIAGLTRSATTDDLARLYLAAIQAVAYGTRHIVEVMSARGYEIKRIMACGGGMKNPVFLREHADITGCQIVLPKEPEAVLLGSSVLGAVASGRFPSVLSAMNAMNEAGRVIAPTRGKVANYHQRKYRAFHRMHTDFFSYRRIIAAPVFESRRVVRQLSAKPAKATANSNSLRYESQ